ncbi:hypothetical protein DRO66_09240 [Candidatus Bathyarchaeota archaeon]|nr:MAG: hypothetical protein DRO66_09240 [Candidatus Bathyarchaeota archaeon]
MTMKDMCEKIVEADFLTDEVGNKPTAEEIFNYSPTGELSQVFEWYNKACVILGKATEKARGES